MQPFQVKSDIFRSSVALDASTVGETTVTAGVYVPREDEIEILDQIYSQTEHIDFKPFYDKANKLEQNEKNKMVEGLLDDLSSSITTYHHRHERKIQTHRVEAVHEAIIVDDVSSERENQPLVLIDGGENKGLPFIRAIAGLREDIPPTAHNVQSELYYPQSLLADLIANYLATKIDEGEYKYADPLLRTPSAKRRRSDSWGPAYSGIFRNELTYDPIELPQRRGGSVRERIRCWYDGSIASANAERPMTDSITPIINFARENDYEGVATILSGL